jgi:hypothetical protein
MMETQNCSIRFCSQSISLTKANCTIRWTASPWTHQFHHMVKWSSLTTNSEDSSRETTLLVQVRSWYIHGLTPFQTHLSSIQSNIRFSMETEEACTFQYSGKEQARWLAEAIYQKCTHTALSYMPVPITFHRSTLFVQHSSNMSRPCEPESIWRNPASHEDIEDILRHKGYSTMDIHWSLHLSWSKVSFSQQPSLTGVTTLTYKQTTHHKLPGFWQDLTSTLHMFLQKSCSFMRPGCEKYVVWQ